MHGFMLLPHGCIQAHIWSIESGKATVENKNQYSFVNVLIFLGNIVLGSKENFDLKGTILLDLSNIIENIDLLIHTESYLDLKNIIDLDVVDWDEYYCSTNDLLPRGASLFDGDRKGSRLS